MPTNQPAAAERADRCGSAEGAGRPDQDDRLQGECDPLHSTPPGSASREAGAALRMRTRVAKATPARTNSIRIQSDLESNFLVSVRNFEPYSTVHPLNARLLLSNALLHYCRARTQDSAITLIIADSNNDLSYYCTFCSYASLIFTNFIHSLVLWYSLWYSGFTPVFSLSHIVDFQLLTVHRYSLSEVQTLNFGV